MEVARNGTETLMMPPTSATGPSADGESSMPEDDLNPFELAPGRRHDVKPRGMVCTHCQQNTVLVGGEEIYPDRPDLFALNFWLCRPCQAWVGCHKPQRHVDAKGKETWSSGSIPLGTVANKELRGLRNRAHALFDPMWKSGSKTRAEAYRWLAELYGVPDGKAHIAWSDAEQCKRVIEALKPAESKSAAPAPIDVAVERRLAERFAGKVNNLRWLAGKLVDANLLFQVRNDGHHVIIHAGNEVFDAWPSTKRWKVRSTGEMRDRAALVERAQAL